MSLSRWIAITEALARAGLLRNRADKSPTPLERRGAASDGAVSAVPRRLSRTDLQSVVVYQPLPKLKNANDSDVNPALEVCDPLRIAFDTWSPTRAGLEASLNSLKPHPSGTTIVVC